MKKRICVVTTTRAEFGLLEPLMRMLNDEPSVGLSIVVTGSHLSELFGDTVQEIQTAGLPIDQKIAIFPKQFDKNTTVYVMGQAIIRFGEYFEEARPDIVVLLGDRYETLAIATAAVVKRIPIAHIHGGEITEGAYDNSFRHAITKMGTLHFASCDEYAKRIIQMGEQPATVFNVGALGVENIHKMEFLPKQDILSALGFSADMPYALVTYHPETLSTKDAENEIKEVLAAISETTDMNYVITKANADDGGCLINKLIDEFENEDTSKRMRVFDSLGKFKYLNTMKYCDFVMGNSSSGIIEAPAMGRPTINIGNRQGGRTQTDSVINCLCDAISIRGAISLAMSDEIIRKSHAVKSPFDRGDTSRQIVSHILNFVSNDTNTTAKVFFDIEFEH
jgi:GDP/UDP-N,N'-diacetylbacillosamine 2-epimerase (hydrolysing)